MRHTRDEPRPQQVTYKTSCDACAKEVPGEPDVWHHFERHHGDWGNDSVESWDYFDACCWECYVAIVRREFDDYGDYGGEVPTLEIDGMGWHFLRSMLTALAPPRDVPGFGESRI
jgi:hypothetical protein